MMLRRIYHIGRILIKFKQSPIASRAGILHQPRVYNSRITELARALERASSQPASLSSIEEKLLNLITPHEDDALLNGLDPKVYRSYDYESLCELFTKMALIGRRNTPLMKAAAMTLCKLSLKDEEISGSVPRLLIATIDALSKLNYPNSTLLSKLIWDLNETINYDDLGPKMTCRLIRALVHLRWRNDDIINKLIEHIYRRGRQIDFDREVLTSLFHICAHLNHQPIKSLAEVRKEFLEGERESFIKTNPRDYLDYVWCLASLRIAKEADIQTILSKDFHDQLQAKSEFLHFVDILKLLNIRALSRLEFKLNEDDKHLDVLAKVEIRKSAALKRLSENVKMTIKNLIKTSQDLRCDVVTPFGFVIDFELLLDDNANSHPLPDKNGLEDFFQRDSTQSQQDSRNLHKCALMLTPYDSIVLNSTSEVVGHERMASQILEPLGYKTIYITEVQLNKLKTSADLVNYIKTRLVKEITNQSSADQKMREIVESSIVSS